MAAVHAWKVAVFLAVASGLAAAQDASPQPPSFRLGDAASPRSYEVRLEIDPASTGFAGESRIEFTFSRAAPVLWLNARKLTVEAAEVRQGERVVPVEIIAGGEEFVGLRAAGEPFAAGEAVATLRYRGSFEPLDTDGLFRQQEAGAWYVVSQFESMSARRAMPCFDEPGWKTPWKITIDAPAANVAVSNSPEAGIADVAGRPGWKRHEFAVTKPLPSYLVALAVGPFDVVDGGTAGAKKTPLRYLAPKGRGAETRYAREATPRLLEIMEEYFGIPYPFEKLDSVVIPQAVGFGAMENVGLITYDASLLLAAAPQETLAFRRRYAAIAAHEIAHMWFGDFVTLAWWDDVWLNESFATWIGRKALYRFNPQWDTGESRARRRGDALAIDRLATTRRVRTPVDAREDMGGAFNAITYQKGSAILEMFEQSIGAEPFRKGVHDFLERHAYGSATSADFFRAIAQASGRGEGAMAAFAAFVDQPGAPLIDASLRCEGGRGALEVSQQRLAPKGSKAEAQEWTTPACFRHPGGTLCRDVGNVPASIELPSCPEWILGNAGGVGHYVVRYDAALMKRLLKSAPALPIHEAAAFVSDSGLLAQSGLLSVEAALDVAEAGFRHSSPVVRLLAVYLLSEKLPDARLDEAQLKKKRAVIARYVQPLARQVGWVEREKDGETIRDLRVVLLPYAALSPGGEALRTQARKLALAWQRDHESISPSMVAPVLDTAARFADRITYDLLESVAVTAQDAVQRHQLQAALAKVRDPALRTRALSLAVAKSGGAPTMSGRDVVAFLRHALEDEHNRAAAFEFVRAHFEELIAKMPEDSATRFPVYVKGFCTSAGREAFVAFFRDRVGKFRGGPRNYNQALETIDLCIAARS